MPGTLDFSVIIVSWNVRKPLQDCLESIFRLSENELPSKIFVVDNASTDGTVAMVQQNFPKVTLIANKENKGFAAANNQAIVQIPGGAILLLNPDTIVSAGAFLRMLKAFTDHPKAGIVGPKLLNPDGSVQPSVRRLPTAWALAAIALKFRHFWKNFPALRNYLATDLDSTFEQKVGQVMGAAFLIRREVLNTIGLLDEGFHVWFEEVDYCKRAADAGWETWYVPTAQVTHLGGQSFQQQPSVTKQRQWRQSVQHYAKKHFTLWQRAVLWKCGWIGVGLTWVINIFTNTKRKSLVWLWGIPVVVTILLGLGTLKVGILSDDWDWMYEARQTIEQPIRPFISNVGGAFYRPLSTYSFSLDYKVAKYNGIFSHVHQVFLTALFVALFVILVWRFTGNVWLSRTSGILFALWPTHHEVTTWLAARPDLLCAIFFVSALLTFDAAVRRPRLWLVALTVLFATSSFLSKENGIIIIPALFLYTFSQRWFRRRTAWLALFLSLIMVSFFVYVRSIVLGQLVGGYNEEQFSLHWRDITQLFRSLVIGWVNWSWFAGHTSEQATTLIRRILTLVVSTGLLALVILQLRNLWHERRKVLLLLAWSVVIISPVLPMLEGLDLGQLTGTRFLFLFSSVVCFAIALLLYRIKFRKRILVLLIVTLAIAWGINLQPWRMAAARVQGVRQQLIQVLATPSAQSAIYIRGLPGDIHGAYMWYARRSVPELLVATYGNPLLYSPAVMDDSPFCRTNTEAEVYVLDWKSKTTTFIVSRRRVLATPHKQQQTLNTSVESFGSGEFIVRWDATISTDAYRAIAIYYTSTTPVVGQLEVASGATATPNIGKVLFPANKNGWLQFTLCQSRGWTLNPSPKALHLTVPLGTEIKSVKFIDPR